MSRPAPHPARARRRGFALPLVIMLVMLAGLLIVVMLQRSTIQGYTVRRQMDSYLEHHASRGFQEVLGVWTQSLGRYSILEVIDEDGHAFDLKLNDGSGAVVSISIQDAQGGLINSLVGLNEQQEYMVFEPLNWLETMYPGRVDLVRPAGPIQVSARTAPKEVLDAIEAAILDAEPTGTLASEIIKARGDGTLDATELAAAGNAAGFSSGTQASDFRALLTHEPSLFRAVVELYQPRFGGGMRLAARYSGLLQVRSLAGGGQGNPEGLISSSLFLSWGPLPIE
jgi:hypothetical protein